MGKARRPVAYDGIVLVAAVLLAAGVVTLGGQTIRWIRDTSNYFTYATVEEEARIVPYQAHTFKVSYVDAQGHRHGSAEPVSLEVPPWLTEDGEARVTVEAGHTLPIRVDRADGSVVEAAAHPPATIWHSAIFWFTLVFTTFIALLSAGIWLYRREGSDVPGVAGEFHGWAGRQQVPAAR